MQSTSPKHTVVIQRLASPVFKSMFEPITLKYVTALNGGTLTEGYYQYKGAPSCARFPGVLNTFQFRTFLEDARSTCKRNRMLEVVERPTGGVFMVDYHG